MAIGFYIFRIFAWLISRLPFWLLHIKSDFVFLIMYYMVGYRKKVVFTNLHNAFPEKSEEEIRKIGRQFFRNLCDIILEDIKVEGMSKHQLKKRMSFANMEILDNLFDEGRDSIMALGHCGNWEWSGPSLSLHTKQFGVAAVKPLSDKRFNAYMEGLRSHFNEGRTFPFKMTLRHLVGLKDKIITLALAGDQTPTRQESKFWTIFMNQETPFFEGIGKLAHSRGMGVFYVDIERIKRGYYRGTISLITKDGSETTPEAINLEYIRRLEDSIRRNPDNWLWSHRRWKHKRESEPLILASETADIP